MYRASTCLFGAAHVIRNAPPAFDPHVAGTAGVCGGTHAQRHVNAMNATQTREQVGILALFELRELVEGDVLELGALVLEVIVFLFEITEGDRGAAREGEALVTVVPLRVGAGEPRSSSVHDGLRLREVAERSPHDERGVSGDTHVLERAHK